MASEQLVRQALRSEAERHLVNTYLPSRTALRARMSRAAHLAGAVAVVAALVLGTATVAEQLNRSGPSVPASGQVPPAASTVASGTAPNGSPWTLYSFANREGADCFGLSASDADGSSRSCHAVPDDPDKWLHIQSVRLTDEGRDAGGALFGEVSREATEIKITLASGKVVAPELAVVSDRPYAYFVAFLEPAATGTVTAYGADERPINEVAFLLDRGLLGPSPGNSAGP